LRHFFLQVLFRPLQSRGASLLAASVLTYHEITQQTWDASLYAGNGRFVALLAESMVEALQPQPGERILDLGCGDGFLTRRIAESGATVVGADSSPQMVAAAKEQGADAHCVNAESLLFDQQFDAVFSNAALHWMSDQDAVLRGVRRALKPGGRFVAECGGQVISPRFASPCWRS
jgi:trans-aconitate methyltransferase